MSKATVPLTEPEPYWIFHAVVVGLKVLDADALNCGMVQFEHWTGTHRSAELQRVSRRAL